MNEQKINPKDEHDKRSAEEYRLGFDAIWKFARPLASGYASRFI
ncbi:hypothetical protein ENTCAN_09697 [Enterobacter cancerogenus ATCC 35316]|nr:hypothetical protein ENTCAN_09697 [Enterobacter cancerogenus ATCC 35316]